MRFLEYTKDLDSISINKDVFKRLTEKDYREIRVTCFRKLEEYFSKIQNN